MKTWAESDISVSLYSLYNYIPLVWASIHCKLKMDGEIGEDGKIWYRTPTLQVPRSRSKTKRNLYMNRLIKIRLKNSRNILG